MNCVVKTPGRCKKVRVCHYKMLKKYFDECDQNSVNSVPNLANVKTFQNYTENNISVDNSEKDFN
jgi:hypothetical protein